MGIAGHCVADDLREDGGAAGGGRARGFQAPHAGPLRDSRKPLALPSNGGWGPGGIVLIAAGEGLALAKRHPQGVIRRFGFRRKPWHRGPGRLDQAIASAIALEPAGHRRLEACRCSVPWRRWRWRSDQPPCWESSSATQKRADPISGPDQPAHGLGFHHQAAHPRRSDGPTAHPLGRAS